MWKEFILLEEEVKSTEQIDSIQFILMQYTGRKKNHLDIERCSFDFCIQFLFFKNYWSWLSN